MDSIVVFASVRTFHNGHAHALVIYQLFLSFFQYRGRECRRSGSKVKCPCHELPPFFLMKIQKNSTPPPVSRQHLLYSALRNYRKAKGAVDGPLLPPNAYSGDPADFAPCSLDSCFWRSY